MILPIEANDVKYNVEKYVKPTLQFNLKYCFDGVPNFFLMCYEFHIRNNSKFMEIKYLRCFLIHSCLCFMNI